MVAEVFESSYIAPLGSQVDAFEQEFTEKINIPYAVALSSGTAAMHLALKGVGVKQGQPIFIGDDAIIGAGTAVTNTVDPNTTVVGVPAKPIKKSRFR